jgi:N6-L-threonylcarbamoyladenine synthase
MTENILGEYGRMPVLYAGGVMSNCRIRERLERKFHAYFGAPAFSADNAAGTSLLCRYQHMKGE